MFLQRNKNLDERIKKVQEIRTRITDLKAALDTVKNLPQDSKSVRERAGEYFDSCFSDHHEIRGVKYSASRFVRGDGFSHDLGEIAVLLMFWADRENTREKFVTYLAELAEVQGGITRVDRLRQVKKLEAEILRLETEEEDVIEKSENSGFQIYRRADADVRIVFGIITE